MAQINITHTAADGTLAVVIGGYFNDGIYQLLLRAGFKYSKLFRGYYIPRSRGRGADTATIGKAERLLKQFEHTVHTVVVDEPAARQFAAVGN